jgi:transcriptional regulator with XRE-family HTH domain
VLRIRFERTNQKLSQSHVALHAGIPQPTLSLIEIGRLVPTPDELQRLAAALRVKPDDLLRDVAVLGSSR